MKLFHSLLLSLSLSLLAVFDVGCDDPNTPDLPNQPYKFAASYLTRGIARHVDAEGSFAAVADGNYGALVLNVADLANVHEVWNHDQVPPGFELPRGASVYRVFIDPVHSFVGARTDNIAGAFPVYNYDSSTYAFSINLGTAIELRDVVAVYETDSLSLYGSDANDGFVQTRFCRADAGSPWEFGCGLAPLSWQPPHGEIRGQARRADNIFAIAIGQEGVHLHDGNTLTPISSLALDGIAYDCAWYGTNTLIVAAQYHLYVVDVTTMSAPRLISTFNISGADRLQQVVVQDHFAAVLDFNDGIYIVDFSSLTNPKLVQSIALVDPSSIDAEPLGNRLYITDQALGLLIYTK
jgi:hypothetical protein